MEKKMNVTATLATTAMELVHAAHPGPPLDGVVRMDDVPDEERRFVHLEYEAPDPQTQHVVVPIQERLGVDLGISKVVLVRRDAATGDFLERIEIADHDPTIWR